MSFTVSTPNTIVLKGDPKGREAAAAAAITPGMLIEGDGSGAVQAHSTADGVADRTFALENEIIGGGIDTAYATGDQVLYGVFQKGDEAYALIASGQNVSDQDVLASAGDGTLKVVTPGAGTLDQALVARAIEDVNNSAGPGNARLRVAVL